VARQNVPLIAFNRGLIDPKALARVDLDRARLSAEVMDNWLPKTQGAMTIRPGTKFFGSSINDTGAEYLEFVAATDDVALLELTNQKMRPWIGSDAHSVSLLGRPLVDTTLTLSDTGWTNASTGGNLAQSVLAQDTVPAMEADTTDGVTVSAGAEQSGAEAGWRAFDDDVETRWEPGTTDTGTWWVKVNYGAGNTKQLKTITIRASHVAEDLANAPSKWRLQGNDVDTGDGWTTEVDTGEIGSQTGWSVSESRTFEDTGFTDTGGNAWQFWRLQFKTVDGGTEPKIAEIENFLGAVSSQAEFGGAGLTLNPTSIGALAKATKQVNVDTGDQSIEHSLAINVTTGPVILRVGSSAGNDDLISETSLGTGRHNLAFTPSTVFHVTVQSDFLGDRTVGSLTIGDSGTVELTTPWTATDLDNIRYDQSADVIFTDCKNVRPQRIERRGTGRSFSVVDYAPTNGPFRAAASSSAKLSVSQLYGNTTMNSDIPFFRAGHEGALVRVFHSGQSGQWPLGALDAVTDAIEVTGITDTGTAGANRDRRISVSVSGTYTGGFVVQKSFDGPETGFKDTDLNDTGTATGGALDFDDPDNNIKVYYRVKLNSYTSGVAIVDITYGGGGITGTGRITSFNSNTDVDLEVLSRFSDTGGSDSWQEGSWSTLRGFPTSVALHDGRLFHASGANLFGSVSDDFENFDDTTVGDAAPLNRSLGSGPVDNVFYLVSLLRLVVGTTGSELAVRASSIDEPLTPSNSSAKGFSTRGSMNLRALKLDTQALFVQRSKKRVFVIGFADGTGALGDYRSSDLTVLVPDLLSAGVKSIAVQRQPDTRIHCVLGDGTVGILTYEPDEDVVSWSTWSTDGTVERAMVLPGESEDAVYYHINREINAVTKRYLEKWAMESETTGDTGLTFLSDCAASFTDTGRTILLTGYEHLAGEELVVWADDTGQTNAGKDLSPDVNGVQTRYGVDTGLGFMVVGENVHHAVGGLPFTANFRSAKLAYAAQAGTPLGQYKNIAQLALLLHQTHNNGVFVGSDTGRLDAMPRVNDEGATVDIDKIFAQKDDQAFPFAGEWDPDARVHIRAKAPRPATVLGYVPNIDTQEKV
jgi:hypothetical protein